MIFSTPYTITGGPAAFLYKVSPTISRWKKGYKYRCVGDERFILRNPPEPFRDLVQCPPFINLYAQDTKANKYWVMEVLDGYSYDGPSGLTIDTKTSMAGAKLHDAAYELILSGMISLEFKPYFDELLGVVCVQSGMWEWRARAWVRAVKRFGLEAATKQRKIYEAA